MIYYSTGLATIFKWRGSVFPKSTRAALPCALLSGGIRFAINEGHLDFMDGGEVIMTQTQAWAGFSVLVGFLIIFRSSQAYSRFWDGCAATHHMRADWFDAASILVSFTDTSKAPKELVSQFKHTIVRLISMMNSAALMDLEEMNNTWGTTSEVKADTYVLLDPLGLDEESLNRLHESTERVMLIFQWIQLLIIRNMENGVLAVPPPILSRAYQELAAGMVAFHDCVKISDTPFPFPYAQNCELLLVLHWALVPWVVSQWVTAPFWAFIFVFVQVFCLWSLEYIAVEIENPFGTDNNSLDGAHMQAEMNKHLVMLLSPTALHTPTISARAVFSVEAEELDWSKGVSFRDVWTFREKHRRKSKGLDRGWSMAMDRFSASLEGGDEAMRPTTSNGMRRQRTKPNLTDFSPHEADGVCEETDMRRMDVEQGDRLREGAHSHACFHQSGGAPPSMSVFDGVPTPWSTTNHVREAGGMTPLSGGGVPKQESPSTWQDYSIPIWDKGNWEALPTGGHQRPQACDNRGLAQRGRGMPDGSPSRPPARSPHGHPAGGSVPPSSSGDEGSGGSQRRRRSEGRQHRQERGRQRV